MRESWHGCHSRFFKHVHSQLRQTAGLRLPHNYNALACVAGGMRERASGGRAAIFLSGEACEEFASGEAASEFPACHISYGFCLPPTFIAFDESIK